MMHGRGWNFALAWVIGCAACGASDAPVGDTATESDAGVERDAEVDEQSPAVLPEAGPEPTCDPLAASPTWTVLEPALGGLETPSSTTDYPYFAGLIGVAYGSGRFVALGNAIGTQAIRWATSEDGRTWTEHEQANGVADTILSTISKLRFLNGRFVFFAEHANEPGTSTNGGGFVYSSVDGGSWKATRIDPGRLSVTEFDASPLLTMTAGRNGDMRASDDLVEWSTRSVPQTPGFSFNDIAYGGGRWVATINGGGEVFGSADGDTWTKLEGIAGPGGYTVEYGNGIWIAQGSPYRTSTDGAVFSTTTPTGDGFGTAARFAGGRFVSYVAYGDPGFRTSVDGIGWSKLGSLADVGLDGVFSDIAYGRCLYVAAGQHVKNGVRQPLLAVVNAPPHAE